MGSLQEPRKEDAILVDKPGPHDNYSCYRLQASNSPQSPCPNTPPHSRDLYGVVREACAQQNVKWPVECQVIQDKIHHIEDWPIYPEAFYEQSGTELRPQPVGDELGRLVYHYYPTSSVNYFSRSCVGGNKFLNEDVRPPLEEENDTTLQFESRFECGNLGKSVQVSECYYELHLRADMYTSRHTQWFYFAVSNTRKDITYRFSIVNLNKGDSLYNHGMRPLMYSCKEADIHSVGWRRCATNIVYFKNHDRYCDNACFDSDDDEDDAPSFTLTFNITFPHDHDTVYLAHCYPYSYSDLQEHLLTIQNDPFKSGVCRQRILCRSLAGNPVYLLTITSQEPEEDGKKKRAVVLTARVHPGETPSSWIMKGVLDFLTADHPKSHDLRSQFIFKVIPMLNPDGVIVGNHRCSLVGRDLNRQYKMVVKEMFPAIWHTKAMVRRLMDEHGVVMYGDFHAHSRKHNIFLYGCENRRNQDNHLREQIFPLLLHYNGGDKFSFRSCKFKVHRCKEGTARVVVWMMGVLHSYTMEASFGGASEGPRAGTHYNIHDFISMGRQFCETLVEYFDPQPIKEKLRNKLWSRLIKKGSSADEPASIDFSETNSSSGESDRQATPIKMRKKKIPRNPRRKVMGGRSSVAQVVEKVTTQIRMDKSDRRSKGLQHSRSGSSSSPVASSREPLPGDRVSAGRVSSSDGAAGDSNLDGTVFKTVTDSKPCLKKLLERPRTSASALDPTSSGRTSLRPTQYKLEEALPTPCSAPPLRRSSHSLIRPPLPQPSLPSTSVTPRESSISPIPPEKPSTGSVNEHLHRLNNNINNRHRDPSQSDGYEADGRDSAEPRGYLDLTTKSYMERMGELMSSRHAISDTEEGTVSNFWDADPQPRLVHPTPRYCHSSKKRPINKSQIEANMYYILRLDSSPRQQNMVPCMDYIFTYVGDPGSNLSEFLLSLILNLSHFSRTEPLRRLDALEPVIAKTRLHDPRKPVRPTRPSQNLYASVRTAHVIHKGTTRVQRSLLTRREKHNDQIRDKKREKVFEKQLHYLQDDMAKDNKTLHYHDSKHHHYQGYDNDNLLWVRGPDGEPIDIMTDPIHNGNLTYHRYSSQPSQLDMGPCDDLLVSGEEVVLRLSVPSVPKVPFVPKIGEESSRYVSMRTRLVNHKTGRRGSTSKLTGTRDIDEEQLCADIATCDTLFLDTAAQETPELIAARNLKGKVKKKKAVKGTDKKKEEKDNGQGMDVKPQDDMRKASTSNFDDDQEKESSESLQQDCKVKKKIKIVIGKKAKTKATRKSLRDKDTLTGSVEHKEPLEVIDHETLAEKEI
ncbi:Cytosolic carboxypeptidase 2 [Halocaridina rubra]|uniref:Cytosolic carboxypeptidase 2 n=1 Tax=Halocaridina rubra TaxID=373956 RepID=A0AAN8XB46_HALRR